MLLNKMYRIGVRGVGLEFVSLYFCKISQFIKYGVAESCVRIQNLGIIQGFKVGPLSYE